MTASETEWPSVRAAQSIVLPSYQWMLSRIESADGRLQTLVTFIATLALGVPAAVHSAGSTLSLTAGWFLTATALAVLAVVIGIVARSRGAVILPDPQSLYNTSLQLTEWEFQRDALFFAGKHFAKNKATVEAKSAAVSWMTILFLAELVCLFLWIIA